MEDSEGNKNSEDGWIRRMMLVMIILIVDCNNNYDRKNRIAIITKQIDNLSN